MGVETFLPAADPVGLPAPYWLLKTLLLVTFTLHILAMNCMLGSAIIAATARLWGRSGDHVRLAVDLGKKVPTFLAATVTIGIAPLLFVQVLYGQFFYSSTVLIAWFWLSVVCLIIFAYYGFYSIALSRKAASLRLTLTACLSVIAVLCVAFIYTNNFTLMLSPGKWKSMYLADPSGLNLNLSEWMLFPRLIHSIIAAIAIAGLVVVVSGLLKKRSEPGYGLFLIRHGATWFLAATMAQFVTGIWYLISLPREKTMLFLGKDMLGTGLLAVGIIAGLGSVMVMLNARRTGSGRQVGVSIELIITTIISMQGMRDVLRMSYLSPYYRPEVQAVAPQWSVLAIFLVLFVAALALWGTMMKRYFGQESIHEGHERTRMKQEIAP